MGAGGSWIHFGVALTSNEILWNAQSKRALAHTLIVDEIGAVDMESTAIARVCGRRGLPFLVARSITDLLDEDLLQALKGEDLKVFVWTVNDADEMRKFAAMGVDGIISDDTELLVRTLRS